MRVFTYIFYNIFCYNIHSISIAFITLIVVYSINTINTINKEWSTQIIFSDFRIIEPKPSQNIPYVWKIQHNTLIYKY